MLYKLYRTVTTFVLPILPFYLKRRAARGKEDPARIQERFGHAGLVRPEGQLIWLHAASVGEMNTALSLIAALAERLPQAHFLLTTVTVTSAKLAAQNLPPRTLHQFAPVDALPVIRRFLQHWQPQAALFMESELWPNMVVETAETGAKLAIINGRMSDGSFRMWSRFPVFSRFIMGAFDTIYAGSRADARKFSRLGARDVQTLGNLKFDAPPLPCDEAALNALQTQIGTRPVWLAASTHPGEEEQIAEAHGLLLSSYPDLLTIIVPRHAVRGPAIANMLERSGSVALRSRDDAITPDTAFYIANTMGELGLFYRLCNIIFIGGSLVAHGGQNLIEPARLGCAILCGPHMENFAEVVEEFQAEQAITEIKNATQLAEQVRYCLAERSYRELRSEVAQQTASRYRGLTAQMVEAILPLLQ